MEHKDKLLLRIEDAAEMLSLSRATVYNLMKCGAIPYVRLGSAMRIPTAQLLERIESMQVADAIAGTDA